MATLFTANPFSRNTEGGSEQAAAATHASKNLQVRVVGIGSAGINSAAAILNQPSVQPWHPQLNVHLMDTDAAALNAATASASKTQLAKGALTSEVLGSGALKGLSTGGCTQRGATVSTEAQAQLEAASKGADMVFFIAGLGGGTGSACLPEAIRAARALDIPCVVFALLPFRLEGARRTRAGTDALQAVRSTGAAVVPIACDILLQTASEGETLEETFSIAHSWIAQGLASFMQLMFKPGLLQLDFANVQAALNAKVSARTLFGLGTGSGEHALEATIKSITTCPLLHTPHSARGADKLIVHVRGGRQLALRQLDTLVEALSEHFNSQQETLISAQVDASMHPTAMEVCVLGVSHLAAEDPSPVHTPKLKATTNESTAVDATASNSLGGGNHSAATKKTAGNASKGRGKRSGSASNNQETFEFVEQSETRGYFTQTQRYEYAGEDLDVPTFFRRGIKIPL